MTELVSTASVSTLASTNTHAQAKLNASCKTIWLYVAAHKARSATLTPPVVQKLLLNVNLTATVHLFLLVSTASVKSLVECFHRVIDPPPVKPQALYLYEPWFVSVLMDSSPAALEPASLCKWATREAAQLTQSVHKTRRASTESVEIHAGADPTLSAESGTTSPSALVYQDLTETQNSTVSRVSSLPFIFHMILTLKIQTSSP